MARLASVALGGFFATPADMTAEIGRLFVAAPKSPYGSDSITFVDPCAGEGDAIFALREAIAPKAKIYLVEMEKERAKLIETKKAWNDCVVASDFFQVHYDLGWQAGAGLLYLNPPYDFDSGSKRLEERFLRRALGTLAPGGWLAFVVPFYALSASADTLSRNFSNFQCGRFPPHLFDFKQVVLFAKKREEEVPADFVREDRDLILAWSRSVEGMPVLGVDALATMTIPQSSGFKEWRGVAFDPVQVKAEYQPWISDRGSVFDVEGPEDVYSTFHRSFPVASRLRAVHLTAAMSAGVFNGVRVVSDNPALPPLLVKGVFEKEYRTVETKTTKNGDVSHVQVQHPKLVITVLDLTTGLFHTVQPSASSTAVPSVDRLTMRDLLDHYGKALMAEMLRSCPVLHDPSNDPDPLPMPPLGRPLYPAQAEAVRTAVKLRREYPDAGVILLGTIGLGKTSVALASAKALGFKRVLVMCPPHLLKGWCEQIEIVLPEAKVHVIQTISDVEPFASGDPDAMHIGILSREMAKLSHGWVSIRGMCPGCGTKLDPVHDYAKGRDVCQHKTYQPRNDLARWLVEALPEILPFLPYSSAENAINGRVLREAIRRRRAAAPDFRITESLAAKFARLVDLIDGSDFLAVRQALSWVMPSLSIPIAMRCKPNSWREIADLFVSWDDISDVETLDLPKPSYDWGTSKDATFRSLRAAQSANGPYWNHDVKWSPAHGRLIHTEAGAPKSLESLRYLLRVLMEKAAFSSSVCGEPLFQAAPPCRTAVAEWIQKRARRCFDMLVLDEAHELSNKDSAQTDAAQRLMSARLMSARVPTFLLTGSMSNGYASSLYMNMYGVSPTFRMAFGRDGVARFVDKYGYWKRVVSEEDIEGEVVGKGAQSHRVFRKAQKAGMAPGVLPLFLLEYILPLAITLQKEDLDVGIPPREDARLDANADGVLLRNYEYLLSTLLDEIKASRNIEGRQGKLWGALARLPSYLDLAAVGNTDDKFEVRWPDEVPDVGGQVIASVPLLDPSVTLPKEQAVLDQIQAEIDSGRNVMLLVWHTRLVDRWVNFCRNAGFKTVYLDPNKVGTGVRQDWITKNVVQKRVQVLVCNPIVIQTGLNNLVHFSTQLWVENPMCDAIVVRQASGRIDRIGQTKPSRIVLGVYGNTAQEQQYKLLMHKIGVSKSVDGVDPEEAFRSAGMVDSEFMGFSVGQQLYRMITGESL